MVRFKNNKKRAKTDTQIHDQVKSRVRKSVPAGPPEGSAQTQTICWHLGKFDWDGPWGLGACGDLDLRKLIEGTIAHFEDTTWANILSASGGKTKGRGTNSHAVNPSSLSSKAKKRLRDVPLDDTSDTIVSLRISGKVRLYGIRDGRVFQLLWYDPWHDIKDKAVCPSMRN